MEHVNKFRTALFNTAGKEFAILESALREKLNHNDESHRMEIQRLQKEIGFLRQQASRANELEDELRRIGARRRSENVKLSDAILPIIENEQTNARKHIPGKGDLPGGPRYVTEEEYMELHQRFLECSRELDRVKGAHEHLKVQMKRWKDTYRSMHLGTSLQGPGSRGQRTDAASWRRSAPAGQLPLPSEPDAVGVGAIDTEHTSGEGSIPLDRVERIQILPGLEEKEITGASGHGFENSKRIDYQDSTSYSETPSSQTQDNGKMEASNLSQDLLPTVPQQGGNTVMKPRPMETRQTRTAAEPDLDVPVMSSERSLKRKRNKSPATPAQKPKIKEETLSSSPTAPNASTVSKGGEESIDLDEISDRLYTPRKDQRKRQRLSMMPPKSPFIGTQGATHLDENLLSEGTDALLEDEIPLPDGGRLPDKDPVRLRDEAWCRREGQKYAAQLLEERKLQRRDEARAKQRRHNQREHAKRTETGRQEAYSLHDQREPGHDGPTYRPVLQPMDANKALPRTQNSLTNQKRNPSPSGWHHGAHYLNCLSEDGESGLDVENVQLNSRRQAQAFHTTSSNIPPNSANPVDTQAQHRLGQLLAKPSPDKPGLSPNNAMAGTDRSANTLNTPLTTLKRNPLSNASRTPTMHEGIRSTATKPSANPQSTKTPIAPTPQITYTTPFSKPSSSKPTRSTSPPLRTRPLSHLSLSDFKVNPAQNQGYSHPFKETIRSHAQRKCLPGCTRLECCGAVFRKMAQMGLFHPRPSTGLFSSSPPSTLEEAEYRMMQEYLGDQAYKLKKMSKEEKEEVLLQAKTKILADQYGKHREVYAREPSPVGFWDVDMPESQEVKEQAKLAEMRTRQKVEERYKEAMRKDGVWKFRDE